jgi:hypothetical protein
MKYFLILSLLLITSCASRVQIGPDVIIGSNEQEIYKPEIE